MKGNIPRRVHARVLLEETHVACCQRIVCLADIDLADLYRVHGTDDPNFSHTLDLLFSADVWRIDSCLSTGP